MPLRDFPKRHIGPRDAEVESMLKVIGVSAIDELIDKTIPAQIRLKKPLDLAETKSEHWYLRELKKLSLKNKLYRSYIGMGYYNTIVPPAVQRNVLENPGWYTAYTPYQSEISQGRLETLLNFQTMVMDLTGMEMANASLLDETTAASEAMLMFYNSRLRSDIKEGRNKFFVSCYCYPQTIAVVEGRAKALNIEIVLADPNEFDLNDKALFGALIQYPDALDV